MEVKKYLRNIIWEPYAFFCRYFPLAPFHLEVTQVTENVRILRIDNIITKIISKIGGGYDYSVLYLIDNKLLIDTGYPWAMNRLKDFIQNESLQNHLLYAVNTHSHEDHIGNNDLIFKLTKAKIFSHSSAIENIMKKPRLPFYREFMFGLVEPIEVFPLSRYLSFENYNFEIIHTPGHSPDHICLYEKNRKWLFSGDLYIAADIDSQLKDVNGNDWIESIENILTMDIEFMFDAHGTIFTGSEKVYAKLNEKLTFLKKLRELTLIHSKNNEDLDEIVKLIFGSKNEFIMNYFYDGWLSFLTASDFSRRNIINSFLK